MPTTYTRYVDPSSSGGNGTTNALSGANAAYASITAWNTAEQKNLTTADQISRLVLCSNGGGTPVESVNSATISGWTTDLTRYILIENEKSHGGSWNTGVHRFQTIDGSHGLIMNGSTTGTNNIVLRGIQLEMVNTASTSEYYGMLTYYQTGTQANTSFVLENSILRYMGSSTAFKFGWYCGTGSAGTAARYFISNNIFQGWRGTASNYTMAIGTWSQASYMYAYNNTFYNCHNVFFTGSGGPTYWYLKNNGYVGCDAFVYTGSNYTAVTNSGSTPTFVSPYTNLHLASTDTTWKRQGTDLSNDAYYPITTDMDGHLRTDSAYDIGMDQYPATRSWLPLNQPTHY